jgi:hypothetical protein
VVNLVLCLMCILQCFYCPIVRHLWWWLGGRPATAATMHRQCSPLVLTHDNDGDNDDADGTQGSSCLREKLDALI